MTKRTIKTATASDAEAVIAVVVLAFSADPAARWAYSDPQQYLRHFPSFVSAFGGIRGDAHRRQAREILATAHVLLELANRVRF